MKFIIIMGLSILLGPSFAYSKNLVKFRTDYCTGFGEGTFSKPNLWKECCFEHDLRYWFGGTKEQQSFSDTQLKICVNKKAGSFYSNLMYYAVRAGHFSPIKHSTHWSWGWAKTREGRFLNLTSSEKIIIKNEIRKLSLSDKYIQDFLLKYDIE